MGTPTLSNMAAFQSWKTGKLEKAAILSMDTVETFKSVIISLLGVCIQKMRISPTPLLKSRGEILVPHEPRTKYVRKSYQYLKILY